MSKDRKNESANLGDLFKAAMALDAKVDAAKASVEAAMELRSKSVKAVSDANGGDNGPFNFKGKMYTIRKRSAKDEDGEVIPGMETWFFVSIGDKDVTNIE